MTDRVDTRPNIQSISLSPKDRDSLAREAQFRQRTCSSAITRRPKHGSINDDDPAVRIPKTWETSRPEVLPQLTDEEDGIDPIARIGTGIKSLPPCGQEAQLVQAAEDHGDTVWSLDLEGGSSRLEDDTDYDPYWREESIAVAGGIAALRDGSLIADDQRRMQELFDYMNAQADNR